MIQQFKIAFKSSKNAKDKYLFLVLVILAAVLLVVFRRWHINKEEELTSILANIIQFAGIFSALLITFIISKAFQIRQEKREILKEAQKLSNRVTDFRRIARVLVNCYGFWDSGMRKRMDKDYAQLNKFTTHNYDLTDDNPIEKLRLKFSEETGKAQQGEFCGVSLYLDLKSLVLDNGYPEWQLWDEYDRNYLYTKEIVHDWCAYHSGDLWYFLVNEWHGYKGCFHFSALKKHEEEQILMLVRKIDRKFAKRKLDNELLGEVGSDFTQFYFPTLLEHTTILDEGLPDSLKTLLYTLFISIISGVIVPILISSIAIDFKTKQLLAYLSITVLITVLTYLFVKLKALLEGVVKLI